MISKLDIQRLLHRPEGGPPVLSVFLDMSVDSDNKRTYDVFLSQHRRRHTELSSDREDHHREALGAAFSRVERWIDDEFDEANKGVAIYTEIGGEWLEALQFPVPIRNQITIDDRPIIRPLSELLERHHRHAVVIVDRESLRLLSIDLGVPVVEFEVETEPYPAPHDVQAGGYSAKDYQKRKAEEVRHFFKEFAQEVGEFVRRYRPDDLILLGTEDNVSQFLDFLPQDLQEMVVHTDNAPGPPTRAAVLERLGPFFDEQSRREELAAIDLLRDRVSQQHFAASGVASTLEQLQEAKVDTLVVARDLKSTGAQCLRCGFYLVQTDSACPYCGGDLEHGIDLAETMIRMAEEQEIAIEFVDPQALQDLGGAGALLKF